jgi:predicted ATPase
VRQLPTGTVTFLFTDIEGSTRLLHELGDGYTEALAEHRRALREAFGRHGGVEVDTQGDAFFFAFARANDAVAAAAEAQNALREGPLRVRMGVHTGEPLVTEEGYVGMDVHRAARIAASGHGGQVVVSQATRDLLDGALELRELGDHRLKDLAQPQRLYQLGNRDFPPLKSLNQSNLPLQPTPLVGRERELRELLELVHGNRLVTLTGPGGSGKTRLALHVAAELVDDFADGVWFVSLAPLRDPELLESTIADVLGASDLQSLADQLATRQILLLLDNFEQLVDAAPRIAQFLQRGPGLKLIVTSRERLHLSGEREYPVPPLAHEEAVALFVERVRATKPDFEPDQYVPDVCRRLDNLPLALELAAARSKVLVPAQMLQRLERRLPLLTTGERDAPERQRTLRATIDWSYDLLTDGERQLLRRLAVFAGSFDIEAAEEVCDADLDRLASLVEKSLLRQTAEGRFFMLETIHEYAAGRFEGDDVVDALRLRHAQRTLRVAEAAQARHHQGLDVLQGEHDDARAALDFLVEEGEYGLALRLANAFGDFWFGRGHVREGRRRLETVLAGSANAPAKLRVAALNRAASFARLEGDADGAERHASVALQTARELADPAGEAAALRELGEAVVVRKDYARAFSLYNEALTVERSSGESVVATVTNLADLALAVGEFERAIEYSAQAAELAEGPDAETVKAIASFNTTSALIQLGRGDEAPRHLRDALKTVVRLSYPELIGWCLVATSALAAAADPGEALVLLGAADAAVDSAGAALGPAEQRLREWALSLLHGRVEARGFEEALQRGRALSIEDAVNLARKYLD